MRFDWILFDIDDTLLDFAYAARKAFSSMLQELRIEESPQLYAHYQNCNHAAWAALEAGTIDAMQLRYKRFADFQEATGLSGVLDPMSMNALFLAHVVEHTLPIDGAMALLEALRPQVGMGIVTNGLKEVQRPRIRKANMDTYFQAMVVSDEIGLAKPQPAFFSVAHQAIGSPMKDRVLVVGDSLISDVRGAQDFGFASCWFNPAHKENTHPWRADFEIQSLGDVLALLAD